MVPVLAIGQTKISGKVTDQNGEAMVGVNILVKGTVLGTITDFLGEFQLDVRSEPPLTLVVSFVGFATQEINITDPNTSGMEILMEEQSMLGQEVVISASKIEESILESPVSIEKMDILDIQQTPADNYYKAIANLKGVDMTQSSINFQIINTRGFGTTGNTRFVQLIDGMDTQAPALNFPIGNLNGPSELDVESVELLPGAASALYGPNAFNGVLLINSKNAFDYQGLSAFVKTGVNHIGSNADQEMAPMLEASLRYAKAYNNKFAFKVNFSYSRADDWHGNSNIDREIARTPEGFGDYNPGSDLLHSMGDEAAINLAIFPFSSAWNGLASSNIFEPGLSAADYAGDLPSHVVSVTPFKEIDLINYNAENIKINTGLYYRLNDKIEASLLYNGGFGTSIYTGAQRYSLSDFGISQVRGQLRGDNFLLRGYGTFENSGGSYITEFLAKRINDQSSLFQNVSNWLGVYGINYLRYYYDQGYQPGDVQNLPQSQLTTLQIAAHQYARSQTEASYSFAPGTPEFEAAKERGLEGVVPFGPKFNDQTRMYQVDGQYDFKNEVDFIDLLVGGTFRTFSLRSNGTIFTDTPGNPITINEYGAYVQVGKRLLDEKLKLGGSVRYDKNQNFMGQVNPRLSAVIKPAGDHNIRLSYQTGFRNPTTQGQHINLDIISSRLVGGLQQYYDQYQLNETSVSGNPLGYEGFSVQDFSTSVFDGNPDLNLLQPVATVNPVEPEYVNSFEIGYKSLINNKLLIDASWYYNTYNNFIAQVRVRKASQYTDNPALDGEIGYTYFDPNNPPTDPFNPTVENGDVNYLTLLNGTADNTFQIYTNIDDKVTTQGAALLIDYLLPRNFSIGGNYSWNVINEIREGFLAEFNTPEHKINFTFGNRKVTDNLGFRINYHWQSEFEWQSSFTIPRNGNVPSYSTLDAQITYKLPSMKSLLKLGGSNILNQKYIPSLGGPNIGAIFYVSLTFDELRN